MDVSQAAGHLSRRLPNPMTHERLVDRAITDFFNLKNVDKGMKEQFGWSIAILCVIGVLISLRFWTRLRIERRTGKDDLICLMAAVLFSLFSSRSTCLLFVNEY
jgi:hypothetical protein